MPRTPDTAGTAGTTPGTPGTDRRRLRAFVVDALNDRGAERVVPGNLGTTTGRLAGRTVAVTVTERADEYVALDLPEHRSPDAPAPGWRPRFHVLVVVDGVTRAAVASTDNTIGALACALDDALANALNSV